MSKSILRIEDMDPKEEYIKCPDDDCPLWYSDTASCLNCPSPKNVVQLKKCGYCSEVIELPLNYSMYRRLSHECEDGSILFNLLSGNLITTREDLEYKIGTGDTTHLK